MTILISESLIIISMITVMSPIVDCSR